MPINHVELTDTFDQWRQKDNAMIDKVNSLSASGDIISSTNPTSGEILVYDGVSFKNVGVTGDITISSSGVATVTGGPSALSKGRLKFIGSMSCLY